MGRLIKRSTGGHQTGRTHVKADKKRRALPPGTRMSKNHKRYTENRANRSDKNRRRRL
jgi:hypothetical protein